MLTRVTNQTLMMSAQRNLAVNKTDLARLQDQATDLKAIRRPSDNPSGTAASLQVRAQQAATAQYERNIDNGRGWLASIDTALSNATDILRRVKDITLQGSSGTVSAAGREGIALELEGLRKDLLGQANASFMGRNVFAGNTNAGSAFIDAAPLVFNGTDSSVNRRVADGTTVRVDADGATVFGAGPGNAFDLIETIVRDLRSSADPSIHLAAIDERMHTVITQHAEVGSRDAQILRAQEVNMQQQGALEAQRTEIEDVDMGRAFLELQLQQRNYSAALAVTAKVLPQSLMDFLR
ncbi:MAG: flagellar hook-associated protein 3 [Arthrobacter sp.]|nr:flagellar hook-associated protein 3 [Arthrobacter sp.]